MLIFSTSELVKPGLNSISKVNLMKKVGIVGLGDMGIGMAKNIVDNGFDLIGYDLRA